MLYMYLYIYISRRLSSLLLFCRQDLSGSSSASQYQHIHIYLYIHIDIDKVTLPPHHLHLLKKQPKACYYTYTFRFLFFFFCNTLIENVCCLSISVSFIIFFCSAIDGIIMMIMIEKTREIFCMNTQNIYLAFVRLYNKRTREEKKMQEWHTVSIGFFYCTLALVSITFSSVVDWFYLCVCVCLQKEYFHMSIYTYIHERDDGIGRYDNIFSFSLFLSLPIVNRSLSLSLIRARALALLKWRQRTEMSSKQSALPHRK